MAQAPQHPRTDPAAPPGPALVLTLGAPGSDELSRTGGKGASLARLLAAGLPVPPGFCLTTRAYTLAAGAALGPLLDDLSAVPAGDGRLGALAARARDVVLAAPVPDQVVAAVAAAYGALGEGADIPVAVRSSATAEDLPFASFAGQQDTFLDVVGLPRVVDAVRRCWASLWTDRAVAYRTTNGIDHRSVRLAVVVQTMVDAAAAGVLFTANPLTGTRREVVIDAAPGLGDAVVSGRVNPDHFVVDADAGTIVERRLGDTRLQVRTAPGGTEPAEGPDAGDGACLTDEQVIALVRLGKRVEALSGAPQDTEWAIDEEGRLWLTQARPITTLYPLPEPRGDGLRVYFSFNVAQGVYGPITPMGRSLFRLLAAAVAGMVGFREGERPSVMVEAGERLFLDLTGALRSTVGRDLLPRLFGIGEARSAAVLPHLMGDPRLAVVQRSPFPFLRRVARPLVRFRVPLRSVGALLRPGRAAARVRRIEADLVAATDAPEGAGPGQRLAIVERAMREQGATIPFRLVPVVAPGFALLGLARRLLGGDMSADDIATVLRGLPGNVTTEMDLALWDLAERIRTDPGAAEAVRSGPPRDLALAYRSGSLPAIAQAGLQGFLGVYGHRGIAEIDVGLPRWGEDPAHVLGILANYLRLEDPALAPTRQFERSAAAAEAMVDELVGRARRRGRLRAGLVRLCLRRVRQLAGLRELPKYLVVVLLGRVRALLQSVGTDLVEGGRLEAAGDIFFLDLDEVRAALRGADLCPAVAERRAAYDRETRRRHIPRILLSDGTEPEATTPAETAPDGALRGSPASPGVVTGTARVVLDPVGARIEPGEILVAPSTDPGWTPLFLTAGGLVMEMGGAMSHGAVVAREYGIPAVVGVAGATERITTGQRITVDGSRGTVAVDGP